MGAGSGAGTIKYLFSESGLNQKANFRFSLFSGIKLLVFRPSFPQTLAGRYTFPGQIKNDKA